MTSQTDVDDARRATEKAFFEKIQSHIASTSNYSSLERLARTFRYVAGGAQPGGFEPESK